MRDQRKRFKKGVTEGHLFLKSDIVMRGFIIFLLVLISLLVTIFNYVWWIIEATRKEIIKREKVIDN